jgi:nicotinamidase-related amidase
VTQALVLVDLQNDYFTDDELARCRDDLLDHSNQLVTRARDAGALVVEVQTIHAPDKSTWTLNMLQDDQGMVLKGTVGAQRLDGLQEPDVLIVKTRDSAFHGTDLARLLRERHVDRVVLAGVSTESCIVATATDAYAYDIEVTLVRDATASVKESLHDDALERLHEQYRQPVAWAADVTFDSAETD